MLIVVAVAMLRAAMLVLVAVLMVIATLHLQDAEAANSDKRGKRNRERKQAAEERDGVSMCIVYTRVCICMDLYACSSTDGHRDADKTAGEGAAYAARARPRRQQQQGEQGTQ
jgi:hypothetical protein